MSDPFLNILNYSNRRTTELLCATIGRSLPLRSRAKYRAWCSRQSAQKLSQKLMEI